MQSTHLREHNLSTILRAVVSSPSPLSRATLAKQTRLTKPTVSKLVEELIGAWSRRTHRSDPGQGGPWSRCSRPRAPWPRSA